MLYISVLNLLAVVTGHMNMALMEKINVFILHLVSIQHSSQKVGGRSLTFLRYLAPVCVCGYSLLWGCGFVVEV